MPRRDLNVEDRYDWRPREFRLLGDVEPESARDAFALAMQFHAGGLRCLASVNVGPGLEGLIRESVPGFVCLAFASELYLKALHIMKLGAVPTDGKRGIHDLKDLYDRLPEPVRATIAFRFGGPTTLPRADFEERLPLIAKVFTAWRYIYEKNPGDMEFTTLIMLPLALFQVIHQAEPAWPAPQEAFLTKARLPMAQFWFLGG